MKRWKHSGENDLEGEIRCITCHHHSAFGGMSHTIVLKHEDNPSTNQ